MEDQKELKAYHIVNSKYVLTHYEYEHIKQMLTKELKEVPTHEEIIDFYVSNLEFNQELEKQLEKEFDQIVHYAE